MDRRDGPVVGQSILVVLYPNPMYPLPVRLQGLVEQLTKAGERYRIKVRFVEINESVGEHLERLIFILHRRQVAQTRKGDDV